MTGIRSGQDSLQAAAAVVAHFDWSLRASCVTVVHPDRCESAIVHQRHVMLCSRSASRWTARVHQARCRKYNASRCSSTATATKWEHLNAVIEHASSDGNTTSDGVLRGRTIAIKDNIVTSDLSTSAASKALYGFHSPFDATVVRLLRQEGAVISAKTNLDEFGMGSHSQNSYFNAVGSHFHRGEQPLSPGGSSGGSAIAVAINQCWAALGTDTGGSVRLPAAYTGIVGFKPSYGLLSRWGVIQYANSLDTVGILANTVADAQTVFRIVNEFDQQDPTSVSVSVRARLSANADWSKKSLKVGIPIEYNIAELSPVVRSTYARVQDDLRKSGHSLYPVSLPSTRFALSAYYVLAPAEASSNLAKYDGIRYGYRTSDRENLPLYARTRGESFGAEVQRRILLGAYTLSSEAMDNYFIKAQMVRRLVQRDFDRVLARPNPLIDQSDAHRQDDVTVDVLLTPTAPTLPPTIAEVDKQSPVDKCINDVFTVPASLAGLPAASVPVKLKEETASADKTDATSIGLQVIGQFGDDDLVLHVSKLIEDSQH